MNFNYSFNKICLRVTRKCNLSCEFCLTPHSKDSNELSADEFLKILSFLKKKSLRAISISGGEPLLKTDIDKIIIGANNLGLSVTLTTNGTILTKQHIIAIRQSKTRVKVSINGDNYSHNKLANQNVFSTIDHNIDKMIEYGIELSLNTVITSKNFNVFDEVISYAINKGIKRIRFIVFIPRGRGYINSNQFMLSAKQIDYLVNNISNLNEKYKNKLSIRYSDFFKSTYIVLETDGLLVCEKAYEIDDIILHNFNNGGQNL